MLLQDQEGHPGKAALVFCHVGGVRQSESGVGGGGRSGAGAGPRCCLCDAAAEALDRAEHKRGGVGGEGGWPECCPAFPGWLVVLSHAE